MADNSGGVGSTAWIRQTLAIQEHCSKLLAEASVHARNPNRAVPEPVQSRSEHRENLLQAKLHASILAFHDYVNPYADSVEELWHEDLNTEIVLDGYSEQIALNDLEAWRFRFITKTRTIEKPRKGRVQETKRYRLLLPVSAAAAALTQLNTCIHRFGWTGEEKELPEKDGPTSVPDHIQEQAPAFQNGAGAEQ